MEAADSIAAFLNSIGIPCRIGEIPQSTLLPGIYLEAGEIVWDPARLSHPGDLLHEAGHIATAPPSSRARMTGTLESTPADEMAAIAWSYGASVHLGLDPRVLFHADGYKGGSDSLITAFATEQPPGSPLLAWYGMTALSHEDPAVRARPNIYPSMRTWLRMVEKPEEADAEA